MAKAELVDDVTKQIENILVEWQSEAEDKTGNLVERDYKVITVELLDYNDPLKRDKRDIKVYFDFEFVDPYNFELSLFAETEMENIVLHAQSTGTAQQFNDQILEFFGYNPQDMTKKQKENKYLNVTGLETIFRNDIRQLLKGEWDMP